MKAEELRKGNWVSDGRRVGFVITTNKKTCTIKMPVSTLKMAVEEVEPIPITEEWLLDFGFEKIIFDSDETGYGENYVLQINKKTKIVFEDDMSFGIESAVLDTNWLDLDFDKLKGVNELQNLFFALTRKELVLTNKVIS